MLNFCMFKKSYLSISDVYFLIASSKTGYRTNPNKVWWATSLAGPWAGGTDIAPGSNNTYGSQTTFMYTLAGTSQTTYIFMGDAWDSAGDALSNYEWLPASISTSAYTVTLQNYAMWKVNPTTGEWIVPRCNLVFDMKGFGLQVLSRSHHLVSGTKLKMLSSLGVLVSFKERTLFR